ncbi:MAG: M28 family metallopeptidase [Solirubrobacterales bacterium]
MDAAGRQQLISELCSFEGRGPGTDAERRAANHLVERLRGLGRRAEVEPTFVQPQYALVYALHAAIAIAGSLLAGIQPAVGFGLVLLAATSLYLDLNTNGYILRRLFFRRGSQNVVSPGTRPEAPMRLILVAHYDAGRTGIVFRRPVQMLARLPKSLRIVLGPYRIFFWGGFAALLPIIGARMAGFEPSWLAVLQLLPTALLIVAVFLLLDIALSPIVPGASDNASGVAAVLSSAEELGAEPPQNLDLWVLLTGAEECTCQGMRSYLRAHLGEIDKARTAVINVNAVSDGGLHYVASEGAVASIPLDRELHSLCQSLADADRQDENRFDASPVRHSGLDDALPARVRGLPAITITGTYAPGQAPRRHTPEDVPEHVDAAALSRATEFVVSLVRLIDRDAGRRSAD